MKQFEYPEIEVEKFDLIDVITTSTCTEYCNDDCMDFECMLQTNGASV